MPYDHFSPDGNATRTRTPEPKFEMDEFEDQIVSAQQKDRWVTIKYEAYEYDGAFRIVKLTVDLNDLQEHHFEYLQEQILESIALRINKNNVVLETKMELI